MRIAYPLERVTFPPSRPILTVLFRFDYQRRESYSRYVWLQHLNRAIHRSRTRAGWSRYESVVPACRDYAVRIAMTGREILRSFAD